MNVRVVRASRLTTVIRFCFQDDRPVLADFKGEPREVAVRYEGEQTVVYAGLGPREGYRDHRLRTAAAYAAQRVAALKRTAAAMVMPAGLEQHAPGLEGLILGAYAFDKYLAEKAPRIRRLEVVSSRLTAADVRRVQAVCDGVCWARDLVNDNADVVTPARLAADARALARRGSRLRAEILDERQIAARGLRLLAAVGQGSPTPPRLILLHYRGNPSSADTTAIVGKGITFDSGGVNLKPSGSIETMRIDMAGAAAVLGTMKALAALRPRINVIGVCAAAHNAIDGRSYLPGDIHRACDGTTVEICNTDAEGRLLLADAIAYVCRRHKPSRVVDLATLTGAILTAFADVLAGLVATDDTLAEELFAAGEATHERLWRLPLYEEFTEAMKGDRSDLRSLAKFKRGYASSITGAAFIRAFAGATPWAHLDIAGTAYNENDSRGEIPRYATGFGMRLLTHWLLARELRAARRGRSRR